MRFIVVFLLLTTCAYARDPDGAYVNSPLHKWFDSLHSGKGVCCAEADGRALDDGDWDTKDGHYRVQWDGAWIDVPDNAVLPGPNLSRKTMVWLRFEDGVPEVRCFIPGNEV